MSGGKVSGIRSAGRQNTREAKELGGKSVERQKFREAKVSGAKELGGKRVGR